MEKLLLIDGNSIMNRAFYGVPDLTNASGLHTNAVYGFLNIIFRFIDEEKPDYLAIAFDLHAPTFRHKMYEAYKGTRKGMPDELREQVPYIKKLVSCMNIKTMELEGYEADDLLGTMAKRGAAKGMEVSLLSGDRDLLQITDEHIKIRIPKTVRGVTTVEDYYPQDVIEKYKVNPVEFIHLKALMGDSSDNIPGVPKVGAKTAEELIVKYHSLDGIYDSVEEITKASIKQSLIDNKDLAYLCLKLATIETNAPIELSFDEIKYDLRFTKEGYDIIRELNLKSYFKRFEDNMSADVVIEEEDFEYTSIEDFGSYSDFSQKIKDINVFSYIGKEDGDYVSFDGGNYYISKMFSFSSMINDLVSNDVCIITEDVNAIYELLDKKAFACDAKELTKKLFSVQIAAYVINPIISDYTLDSIINAYLGIGVTSNLDTNEKNARYANALYRLYSVLTDNLKESNQYELFVDIEMPLSIVLYEMEKKGILVDKEKLVSFEQELSVSIDDLCKKIYEEAGEEFNILSPKQLGVILFEKMNMPYSKKTKTGYSTSADVLEKLAADYPFVKMVLEYRALTKLKSTYAVALQHAIGEDKRIHSHFLQCVTATGRISSAEPNLQNIPVRTKLGRELRKVFIPENGCIFADADYSQIELRILAHLSNDASLIEAFKKGNDIHSATASGIFNVPIEKVSDSQRRVAKVVNFGIIYGMSSFSLGQDLEISRKEAEKYINDYFLRYPGIKDYLDSCVKSATDLGYSITAFNRRRPIPELKSSQFMVREFGKRVAMNAPIQGTAADIMKIAMINVRDSLIKKNLKSSILIQVHDELLLEIYEDEKEKASEILRTEMEHAFSSVIPLSVELNTGDNWYEAK